ncbi:MAG: hypothetical protein ACM3IH_18865 [Sphingobacteriales bacterium]|jgi:hypothetical protein
MIAKPKFKHHQDEDDKSDREHRRREKALDEARYRIRFRPSDPVSVEQPVLPASVSASVIFVNEAAKHLKAKVPPKPT